MNRRTFSRGLLLSGVAALAACTTTTNGKVTTVTLNVNTMVAWGQALVNGATTLAGLTGVIGTPVAVTIGAVTPLIMADMQAFKTATNGALVFTYDATSPATVVTSLVADAQTLANDVAAAVPMVPTQIVADVKEYAAAISTIVSLIQAAISTTKAGAVATPMSESAALAVLRR